MKERSCGPNRWPTPIAASIVFGILKRFGWLDATRDEVRFVLAVVFAGVVGTLAVDDPSAWAHVVGFAKAASAAVFAYNGWKHIVGGWLGVDLGNGGE